MAERICPLTAKECIAGCESDPGECGLDVLSSFITESARQILIMSLSRFVDHLDLHDLTPENKIQFLYQITDEVIRRLGKKESDSEKPSPNQFPNLEDGHSRT